MIGIAKAPALLLFSACLVLFSEFASFLRVGPFFNLRQSLFSIINIVDIVRYLVGGKSITVSGPQNVGTPQNAGCNLSLFYEQKTSP